LVAEHRKDDRVYESLHSWRAHAARIFTA
jgi:hypothetical protein